MSKETLIELAKSLGRTEMYLQCIVQMLSSEKDMEEIRKHIEEVANLAFEENIKTMEEKRNEFIEKN